MGRPPPGGGGIDRPEADVGRPGGWPPGRAAAAGAALAGAVGGAVVAGAGAAAGAGAGAAARVPPEQWPGERRDGRSVRQRTCRRLARLLAPQRPRGRCCPVPGGCWCRRRRVIVFVHRRARPARRPRARLWRARVRLPPAAGDDRLGGQPAPVPARLSARPRPGAAQPSSALAFLAGVSSVTAGPSPSAGAAALVAAAFLAAVFLAGFGFLGLLVAGQAITNRATLEPIGLCLDQVLECVFTPTPIASHSAIISALVIPSFLASSCTRMFFAKTWSAFRCHRRAGS